MTVIFLYTIGFLCIIISLLAKRRRNHEEDIEPIESIVELETIDFYQEIERHQQRLTRLEQIDVDKLVTLTQSLDQLVQALTQTSHQILHQVGKSDEEEIIIEPEISSPKNLMIRPEIEEKMKTYYQLKDEGMSLDEILKRIDMEKGELLFLENLYKSIT